jgi:hypothetical protein
MDKGNDRQLEHQGLSRREFLEMAAASAATSMLPVSTASADEKLPASRNVTVPVSLDDLSSAWMRRRITQSAAMPGLCNDLGAIQIESDIAAIKHPVFPPYSGGNEITAFTLINGRNLAQVAPFVAIQWRAYAVDRRCEADGWLMESHTSLLPNQPGAVIRIKIQNRRSQARQLRLGFMLSARAANTGAEGYAWAVPTIPTDVSSFLGEKGLGQTVRPADCGSGICVANEDSNAFSVQACRPAADAWQRERIPTWSRSLKGNETFNVTLLFTFHKDQEEAQRIAKQWYGREEQAMAEERQRWESVWNAAFTPNNSIFSGSLPVVHSPSNAVRKLYYMGVLTLLTCRRNYGWGTTNPCYLTLWPRRGEGSVYLAWDLPYISGILARLDPEALRSYLRLVMSAPWLDYQTTNLLAGVHGGWECCAHPHAVTSSAFNLMRWQNDQSWKTWNLTRIPPKSKGFDFGGVGEVKESRQGKSEQLTGEQAFRQALWVHREHHMPGSVLVDFGSRSHYLECITTYGHGTAGHTAIQAWALAESARAFGENNDAERATLLHAIESLYQPDNGFFSCLYPEGQKQDAANIFDIGMVLNAIGNDLPKEWVARITRFTREELATPTWSHCLSPTDLDIASGTRADHQWAGCFGAWPSQFLMGALRTSYYEDWIEQWISGLSRVTLQGPFAQAYWAEDMAEQEAGAAPKCFDDLPQGNHWVISSGVHFAEMVLDGVAGLQASVDGALTADARELPIRKGLHVEGILHRGNRYVLDGVLRRV